MKIYIQLLVNEMVSYGIDGFALDLEGDTYANLEQNATDRQAFTDFLVELKAAMTAAVPGSVLHAWVSYTGAPWNSLFTKPQIAAALASVDRFLLMEYSMCSVLVANAPLPFIAEQLKTVLPPPALPTDGDMEEDETTDERAGDPTPAPAALH